MIFIILIFIIAFPIFYIISNKIHINWKSFFRRRLPESGQ